MLRIICISLFCVCLSTQAFAQSPEGVPLHIYVLMGQSNMAGRGDVTDEYRTEGHPRLLMLNKENQWVQARHPLHFDKPAIAGVGPGMAFGIRMAGEDASVRIGLVPCAVGGSSIAVWAPGAYDKATNTHPYDDAIRRIEAAKQAGTIKGVLWHQGESNIASMTPEQYAENLIALIERIRIEAGDPQLPFVMGEIGRFVNGHEKINGALKKVAKKVPYTAVATSEDLQAKADKIHFDSPSASLFGQRFASKMLSIRTKLKRRTSR